MERTGKISKLFLTILLFSMIVMTMNGCAYVNNENWDDMTPAEQEEVRQNFEEEREELEEEVSEDSYAQYILDKVEQAIKE